MTQESLKEFINALPGETSLLGLRKKSPMEGILPHFGGMSKEDLGQYHICLNAMRRKGVDTLEKVRETSDEALIKLRKIGSSRVIYIRYMFGY